MSNGKQDTDGYIIKAIIIFIAALAMFYMISKYLVIMMLVIIVFVLAAILLTGYIFLSALGVVTLSKSLRR